MLETKRHCIALLPVRSCSELQLLQTLAAVTLRICYESTSLMISAHFAGASQKEEWV